MANAQVMEEVFTIQQMVQITGLSAHTLRYYERAGLMLSVGRDDSSGYRYYTRQDVEWIGFIKRLRATGMPIRDVLRYTNMLRQGDETIAARLQLLKEHRQRVKEQQDEVERHLSAIDKKIELYEQRQANKTSKVEKERV